jgi:hypothetical protein
MASRGMTARGVAGYRVAGPRVARPVYRGYARTIVVRTAGYRAPVATFRTTRDRFGRLHRVGFYPYFGLGYPGYLGYYPYDYGYPYDSGYDQGGYDQGSYDQGYYDTQAQQYAPAPSEQYATAPSEPAEVRDNTIPDTSKLVLARKDGQIVTPSAFTVSGDRVVYITGEGTRQSFPVADLDKDTTRQMNEANGNRVAIPD